MAKHKEILSQHKYKNDKSITMYYIDPEKEGIHEEDCLLLEFDHGKDIKKTEMFMRPDEAILLSKLINEAVFKSVSGYETELLSEHEKY